MQHWEQINAAVTNAPQHQAYYFPLGIMSSSSQRSRLCCSSARRSCKGSVVSPPVVSARLFNAQPWLVRFYMLLVWIHFEDSRFIFLSFTITHTHSTLLIAVTCFFRPRAVLVAATAIISGRWHVFASFPPPTRSRLFGSLQVSSRQGRDQDPSFKYPFAGLMEDETSLSQRS